MTTSFSELLTDCLVALGDSDGSTWSRTDVIWPWAIEAMLEFPILRPMEQSISVSITGHMFDLAADFRDIIAVEYPVSQEPPKYLTRKNRQDPSFFSTDEYYDVDRDYVSSGGWVLWTSKKIPAVSTIKVSYLANHKTDVTDSTSSYISVPDEYRGILVAYVVAKGYRERLGAFMQDPTAHQSIITQMTEMVQHAEENYQLLIKRAQEKLAESRTSPHMHSDKY